MKLDRWTEAVESSKLFYDLPELDRQLATAIGQIVRSTACMRKVTIDRVGISTERLREFPSQRGLVLVLGTSKTGISNSRCF